MDYLLSYGFTPDLLPGHETRTPARVTAVHKGQWELACPQGLCRARLKAGSYFTGDQELFPTVGDFVLIDYNPSGDSQIVATLPRRSVFIRKDPDKGRGSQAVAANFDYVFILQSLNHDFNPRRLERYLTLAWQSGGQPVVILTKADLADDPGEPLRQAEALAAGVPVMAVSAKTGLGLEALAPLLASGKTAVLLGSSGVGKSSLVNALAGEALMAVNDIREDDSKGRHTTTHRQMLLLPSGVMVIDTPGMRELGMWDAQEGLGETFEDIEQLFGQCRFSDCAHGAEPGCAVRAALESGDLPRERWDSYRKLRQEAEYAHDRAQFLRRRQQQAKGIARARAEIKRDGKR